MWSLATHVFLQVRCGGCTRTALQVPPKVNGAHFLPGTTGCPLLVPSTRVCVLGVRAALQLLRTACQWHGSIAPLLHGVRGASVQPVRECGRRVLVRQCSGRAHVAAATLVPWLLGSLLWLPLCSAVPLYACMPCVRVCFHVYAGFLVRHWLNSVDNVNCRHCHRTPQLQPTTAARVKAYILVASHNE